MSIQSQEMIGKKFGKLLILRESKERKHNKIYLECECECGKQKNIRADSIRQGSSISCGCKKNLKHGLSRTRFYRIWLAMNNRSNNHKIYKRKGIKVLWNNFEEFRDDMLKEYKEHIEKYGENQTSIDRIDNDGSYSRENCRWATNKEQMSNRDGKIPYYIQ